jgi:hypothetical protein
VDSKKKEKPPHEATYESYVDTLKNIIDFNRCWMYFVSKFTHLGRYEELTKTTLLYLYLNYPMPLQKKKSESSLGHIEHNKSLCFNNWRFLLKPPHEIT